MNGVLSPFSPFPTSVLLSRYDVMVRRLSSDPPLFPFPATARQKSSQRTCSPPFLPFQCPLDLPFRRTLAGNGNDWKMMPLFSHRLPPPAPTHIQVKLSCPSPPFLFTRFAYRKSELSLFLYSSLTFRPKKWAIYSCQVFLFLT